MSSSLLTGVSGVEASQQMLDVVGNNLANVNTNGFKSQSIQFADLLYQTLAPASNGGPNAVGSSNPTQVGSGVRTSAIESNQQQGSLTATGGPTDLALQGNGFFVVNTGQQNLYTRDGSFTIDANNYLVDAAGNRVQRYGTVGEATATTPAFQTSGVNDIKIPLGFGIPGQATSLVTLQGNLSATANDPQAQTLTSAAPFLSGGAPATASTLLNSLDDNTTKYVAGDSLQLQGTSSSGTAVNATLAVDPTTTTLGSLLTAIDNDFPGSTASLDAKGNLVVQANSTGPSKLQLAITDAPGNTGATTWINHGLEVTTAGQDGATVNTGIQVYDPQGTAHTLSLQFQKQGNNTWNLTASIPPGDGTMINGTVQGLTFNDNGSFRQVTGTGPNGASITFQVNGMSASQTINFSFGTPGGFDGLTQFGAPSAASATSQDGYAAGSLSSLSVAKDGIINGVFSNGRTLAVAQLAVANFSNPQGLTREGNNDFSVSPNSGVPLLGPGLTGGNGAIIQGSLESSNVDVALEFTRLITAQRSFEMNARAITISDQVLQDLTNIIQ